MHVFHAICSILELEPFILLNFPCCMTFAYVYLQHFGAGIFHLECYLQHFKAGTFHLACYLQHFGAFHFACYLHVACYLQDVVGCWLLFVSYGLV